MSESSAHGANHMAGGHILKEVKDGVAMLRLSPQRKPPCI
jgi:hypothetical protein